MKKLLSSLLASIPILLLSARTALAQELPKPDLSVWNSDKMKPIRDFANIGIGVIFGIAVLYAVIMVAWFGIKLQSSGSDPIKSQEAKAGLKSTVVGVGITFAAIFIIGLILYVLGIIGIKQA
jgi:Type IV secretion system pilin